MGVNGHRVCGFSAWVVLLVAALAPRSALPAEKTSLWQVSSGQGTVYLLGSIHLLTEGDYPLDERMERAFDKSDVVVFEVDPDSLRSPAIQAYILQNAMCGEGETLQSMLGDSVWAISTAKSESLGVDIRPLSAFKPWFVSLTLALAELQKMGFDPARGVEMHFAAKAKEAEKPVVGLETAKYQLGLFVGLSAGEQSDLLLHTLEQLSDIEEEIASIVGAWKRGSLDDLETTLNKSFQAYPDVYEKLIIRRNFDWVRQIETFLETGKTHLVVVGVGHMPGRRGLVELLREKGFTVEQL